MKDYSGWVNRNVFSGNAYDEQYEEIERFQFEFCGANRNYKNGWFYQDGTHLYGCDLIANWSR